MFREKHDVKKFSLAALQAADKMKSMKENYTDILELHRHY